MKTALEAAMAYECHNDDLNALLSKSPGARAINYTSAQASCAQRQAANRSHHTRKRSSDAPNCGYCGRERHQDRSKCPARNQTCGNCGKMNHFAAVCRSERRADDKSKWRESESGSESDQERHDPKPRRKQGARSQQQIRQVSSEEESQYN